MEPTTTSRKTAARGNAATGPKVLEKTLRVLDLFTVEHPSWSVSEISRELGMPTATAHRIIRALESRSYLARIDSRYRLGFAAVDLGRRAMASVDLRSRMAPVLRDLGRATGETVLLNIYDEAHHGSLCIDRIEATHDLRLTIQIGRVTPIHAGASAKAILAFLGEPLIAEALAHPLEKLAPGTITDADVLREDLARIRRRGWASSYEENNAGAWGLAAPIVVNGQPLASIGLAAPTARYSKSAVRDLARLVLSAARDGEAQLGA
ncbi:MAG: IclR family transcriptional regulator [Solirubrobacterales bacterium]